MAAVAKGPGRVRLPAPATVAIAVLANAALGAAGYVPCVLTVYFAEEMLLLLGWIDNDWQWAVPPSLMAFVLIILWVLYVPLVMTINRAILRRSVLPAARYWSLAAVVLLGAAVLTGAMTYGPTVG